MKKKSCSAAVIPWFNPGKLTAAALFTILLVGCSAKSPGPAATGRNSVLLVPELKMVDFQLVPCDHIWLADDEKTTANSLYWLRAMDCAVRLSPADARAEARRWPDDNWQSAFKQGVLMANGNVTPVERRDYLQRLDTFSQSYPASVRVLMQLWRDDQMGQLQLSEERTRYHHLQQSSDAELDALRQQQLSLSKELTVTRRKLETLTDIERQLSSRRSPDTSDSSHTDKSGDAGSPSAANNTEDGSQP